jgi:hypothetical protein
LIYGRFQQHFRPYQQTVLHLFLLPIRHWIRISSIRPNYLHRPRYF